MAFLPYHHDWKLAFQTDLGLRVHYFGRYACGRDWEIAPSRLAANMVSFAFVEKNACWAVVNGRRLSLRRGDLLVISGADEFSFGHDPAKPLTILSASLALQRGLVANALSQLKFERRYRWRVPDRYSCEFDRVLAALASTSTYRELRTSAAFLSWLACLLAECRAPLDRSFADDRSTVDRILAAEAWGNARLKQSVTLAEWAQAVRLNPTYFGYIFKRETGLRPMEWLNRRRLQMACQYLSATRQSVAEISEACGFASPYYFSRVFRRHFGRPPLVYRKARF